MASLSQIEANRRNARKSTGPKTEAGKNASKLNAIRHGLSSNLFLVQHEDEDEFNAFRDDFFTEHAPSGPTETFLVEQMIAAAWRIRRIHVTEAAFWNLKMAGTDEDLDEKFENPPKEQYFANALEFRFGMNSAANNLARYESRLERAFYKALHELERLRRERFPQPIGFVSPTPKTVPPPAPPEPSDPPTSTSGPGLFLKDSGNRSAAFKYLEGVFTIWCGIPLGSCGRWVTGRAGSTCGCPFTLRSTSF